MTIKRLCIALIQVYKQKGEEYRVVSGGGWLWLSATRNYQLKPMDSVGMRYCAKKIRSKRKKIEQKDEPEKSEQEMDTETGEKIAKEPENADEGENKTAEESVKEDDGESQEKQDGSNEEIKKEKDAKKKEEEEIINDDDVVLETHTGPYPDTIDVTESIRNHTLYPKVAKPFSKLDQLLEKREKQYEVELKQKKAVEQIIERYKKQEGDRRKSAGQKGKLTVVEKIEEKPEEEEKDVDVVGDEKTEAKSNGEIISAEQSEDDSQSIVEQVKEVEDSSVSQEPHEVHTIEDSEDSQPLPESKDVSVDEQGSGNESSQQPQSAASKASFQDSFSSFLNTDGAGPSQADNGNVQPQNTPEEEIPQLDGVSDEKPESSTAAKTSNSVTPTAAKPGTNLATAANLMAIQNSAVGKAVHALIQGSKIQLTASAVTDLQAKLALIGNTKEQVSLLSFKSPPKRVVSRGPGRGKGLPSCHKFMVQKNGRKSIFVLEKHEARKLARKEGKRETPGFKYDCKMTNVNWIYPCPRPTFKTCWRYRTQKLTTLSCVASQLRVLWASLRWDDLAVKPPSGGTNTVTTETDITTQEVLKRRDIGPHGLRSEFLVRKIVVPIGVTESERKGELTYMY